LPKFMDDLISFIDKLPRMIGSIFCGMPLAIGVVGFFSSPVLFMTGEIWLGILAIVWGAISIYFIVYSQLLRWGKLKRKRAGGLNPSQESWKEQQRQQAMINAQARFNHEQNKIDNIEGIISFDLEKAILDSYYSGMTSKEIARKFDIYYKDVTRVIAQHEKDNRLFVEKEE